jgi:glycosyltransferase involved in cell wall biosynthesis
MATVLLLEPFGGGSHERLMKLLVDSVPGCELLTMSPKKWHWRMRTAALHFASAIPRKHSYRVLFASCVLNLAELVALRPDIASIRKVLYFHENQLVYPVRKQQDRDFQYGYNQIISCLTADIVLFNSKFNQESFLSSIDGFLKVMPDYRPRGLADQIRSKCKVLYYPLHIDLPPLKVTETTLDSSCSYKDKSSATSETVSSSAFMDSQLPLHILWPHRWEHDKDPDTFFSVLFDLKEAGCQFVVSVLGQVFNEVPGTSCHV